MWHYVTTDEMIVAHHGVDGQKWGVKNGPPYPIDGGKHSSGSSSNGSITTKKTTIINPELRRKSKDKTELTKRMSQMTNEELQAVNQRVQLEAQYMKNMYQEGAGDWLKKKLAQYGEQTLDKFVGQMENVAIKQILGGSPNVDAKANIKTNDGTVNMNYSNNKAGKKGGK